MKLNWRSVPAMLMALAIGAMAASGASAADFYKGKTIKLVVGSGEGSGVDILGRLAAAHLGDHIPGHPNVIVVNMPLPQSIAGANYVYNIAKPDGLTIGSGSAGLFSRAISQPNIRFDLNKFTWLGNLYSATVIFWMRTDFPCQTLETLKSCPQRLKLGATARGSTGYGLVPELIKEAFGLKMDIIYGYKSSAIMLALERNEVQAVGRRPDRLLRRPAQGDDGQGQGQDPVAGGGPQEPRARSPYHVPWVMDVVPAKYKPLFHMVNPIIDLARPFYAPPNLPADRTQTLQTAFDELAVDKAFQADTRKAARVDISYVPGKEMTRRSRRCWTNPPTSRPRSSGC